MTMANSFVQSGVLLFELLLMLFEFFLFEVFIEIVGPFVIELSGIFEIASTVKSCRLRGNSMMNYSQVGLLLHLCFFSSSVAL